MKKETKQWIKIALEELQSAEYLFERSLFRMVCYHAQQTVEKILKAILTEHNIEFFRTHNVLDLSNAVKEIGLQVPLTPEDAIFLNSIYRARYPADLGLLPTGEPTKEDAQKSLSIAHKVLGWLKEVLDIE